MNTQNAAAGTIRAALRNRPFRLLISGLAVSQIGDWLYNVALIMLVYDRTHSPLWAGLTTAARVVPIVALGLPRLVDDADLPGANAARSAVTGIGVVVGPALSGALLLVGPPSLAFMLNACTFGVSAVAVLAIPAGRIFKPVRSGERSEGLLASVAAGATALRARRAADAAARRRPLAGRGDLPGWPDRDGRAAGRDPYRDRLAAVPR